MLQLNYVVGTQKNLLNEMVLFEHPKHMLKLMGKKTIAIFWVYVDLHYYQKRGG